MSETSTPARPWNRFAWALFGLLLLLLGPSGRRLGRAEAASSAPSLGGSSQVCVVTVDKKPICPKEFALFTFRFNPGSGGVVTVFTEGSFCQALNTAGVFDLSTGVQARVDVKKPIRGWCETFSTYEEAQGVAQVIQSLLTDRETLVGQHKTIRSQIIELEQQIDNARVNEASGLQDLADALDTVETNAISNHNWVGVTNHRAKTLSKGKALEAALAAQIAALEASINTLEANDDSIIVQINSLDDTITQFLSPPTEDIVAEIAKVEFLGADGDNPNFGGGLRFFPDPSMAGNPIADQVIVLATSKPPVPDMHIHFRVFDRDDPTSNVNATIVGLQTPDINGRSGGDNLGPVPANFEMLGPTITKDTDGSGRALAILTLSHAPGDNFEVAADCDESLVNSFNDDSASQNRIPRRISSGMLTLWRRIHLELESFGPITTPLANPTSGVPGYIVGGTITSSVPLNGDDRKAVVLITPDANSVSGLDEAANRWVPGRLVDGSLGFLYEIVSSDTVGTQIRVVVKTVVLHDPDHKPHNIRVLPTVGGFGLLYDDDFIFDSGTVRDRKLTPHLPETDQINQVFGYAFIEAVPDIPGFTPHNLVTQQDLPPETNLSQDQQSFWSLMESHYNAFGIRSHDFWTAYLSVGFQPKIQDDLDDDGEHPSGTLGVTTGLPGVTPVGSQIYIETIRDYAVIHKLNAAEETFLRTKTVAHELTHQFNLDHGSGGIMDMGKKQGAAFDPNHPSPLSILHLRRIRSLPEGPGY